MTADDGATRLRLWADRASAPVHCHRPIPVLVLGRLPLEHNVSQCAVTRRASMSTGHSSRVEADDRPASPADLNGYENKLTISTHR